MQSPKVPAEDLLSSDEQAGKGTQCEHSDLAREKPRICSSLEIQIGGNAEWSLA